MLEHVFNSHPSRIFRHKQANPEQSIEKKSSIGRDHFDGNKWRQKVRQLWFLQHFDAVIIAHIHMDWKWMSTIYWNEIDWWPNNTSIIKKRTISMVCWFFCCCCCCFGFSPTVVNFIRFGLKRDNCISHFHYLCTNARIDRVISQIGALSERVELNLIE